MLRTLQKITTASLCILLVACGGGGSGGTSGQASANSGTSGLNQGGTSTGTNSGGTGNSTGSTGTSSNTGSSGNSAGPIGGNTDTAASTSAYVYDVTARFNEPTNITSDSAGNLYVLDKGNRTIRRIAANGEVSTIPVALTSPAGLEIDASGNLYTSDNGAIRKITPTGNVTTLATFTGTVTWIDIDAEGNLYLLKRISYADAGMDQHTAEIQRVTPDGSVTTLVTGPTKNEQSQGIGSKLNDQSRGIVRDTSGNLYVGTNSSSIIRFPVSGAWQEIIRWSDVTLITDMAFDAAGNLYTAKFSMDMYPSTHPCRGQSPVSAGILRVAPDGSYSDLYGVPPGGNPSCPKAQFGAAHLTVGRDGNIYVTYSSDHTIYRITPGGVATLIAGKSQEAGSSD